MDCTDKMPESPVCSGRNGPTLPAPVPEYGTEPTMADAVDVGSTGLAGVNRPAVEPGFRLDRAERANRQIGYTTHSYATERPSGDRYSPDQTPVASLAERP